MAQCFREINRAVALGDLRYLFRSPRRRSSSSHLFQVSKPILPFQFCIHALSLGLRLLSDRKLTLVRDNVGQSQCASALVRVPFI